MADGKGRARKKQICRGRCVKKKGALEEWGNEIEKKNSIDKPHCHSCRKRESQPPRSHRPGASGMGEKRYILRKRREKSLRFEKGRQGPVPWGTSDGGGLRSIKGKMEFCPFKEGEKMRKKV